MRKRLGVIFLCLIAPIGFASYSLWLKAKYPYGRSHCCLVHIRLALQIYASDHEGRYPAGQLSPEASLSLLYKEGLISPNILRGMIVPEKKTLAALEKGEPLGPETCGWHYVEGLTEGADPDVAILWCKEALGHYGQRMTNGSREALFVGGQYKSIPGEQWQAFLADQQRLLARRSEREKAGFPLVSAAVLSPEGTPIKGYQGRSQHWDILQDADSTWTNSGSGDFNANDLIIHRSPIADGTLTRIVAFSNLISEPVTVIFSNGIAVPTNVIFRMKPKTP